MEQVEIRPNHLENEKLNFISFAGYFLDRIDFSQYEIKQLNGRPRFPITDVVKSLLIMSYHSFSYRRSMSDLVLLKERDFILRIPKVATLSKYMQEETLKKILEALIELSAIHFRDVEESIILDSSSFFDRKLFNCQKRKESMYRSATIRGDTVSKTMKLHIAIGQNSKIITCARTSKGNVHDINLFNELVTSTMKNGFRIRRLLADAAYNSRDNYSFCQEHQIDAYLDFKKNHKVGRDQSALRREKLLLYKNNNKLWSEAYRFRPIVESVFNVMKTKNLDRLRSRKDISKECEMLLKALCYNLTIISKNLN